MKEPKPEVTAPEAGGPSPTEQPFVSVIVLNYNGRMFLEPCFRSVLAQDYPAYEVILVDNGSTDGSCDLVTGTFPAVRQVHAWGNLGYAGGNNLGVLHALGDLVVLLNNDTVVMKGWLEALVRAVSPDDVAVASSLVLTEGVSERYYERNGSINFLGHNIMRVFERPDEVFYCGGASLIFKKEILGIPFEGFYFAYSEDVYLSLRARFLGFSVVQERGSVVRHAGGGTSGKSRRSGMAMLQERNRILNILLFFSGKTLVKIFPLLFLNFIVKCLMAVFPGGAGPGAVLKAYGWMFFHMNLIASKRRMLRKGFRAREEEVIALMTADLTNGESVMQRLINTTTRFYFRLVGLRTIEFDRGGR